MSNNLKLLVQKAFVRPVLLHLIGILAPICDIKVEGVKIFTDTPTTSYRYAMTLNMKGKIATEDYVNLANTIPNASLMDYLSVSKFFISEMRRELVKEVV
ncbi:hypothetical protein PsorP6_015885 [Peronosclerospora sorghi]|uniref:Uncharacterized protein n=1 Tax=Peronosclerospora sorghi TaxID=230839 RepID=A0ACC0WN62_9STRA|nr:hypothetical protein PsorP6_015885 [Peronosclerospora sorghi]